MRHAFHRLLTTPLVEQAQRESYGRAATLRPDTPGGAMPLGAEEISFIAARDSFYLASVGEGGWPYVQHRGGPRGFLHVAGPTQLVFADYAGNRQLFSTGHVAANGRVALFLMDYPARERLKILAHAKVFPASSDDAAVWLGRLAVPEHTRVERVFALEVVGFDWNCSKFITPRFTTDDIAEAVAPLRARVAELEAEVRRRRPLNPGLGRSGPSGAK